MIHYHGTPFSGDTTAKLGLQARHACVSFERPDDIELVAEICQSFIIDNGAFSAWRKERAFNFEGYLDFVQQWQRHPACDWWMIPDVIDGTEQDNRELVLRWSISKNAVPVWHLHESLEWLEQLANEWPRICFGSSGDYATVGNRTWWDRMAQAMPVVCDGDGLPITKLHGLRMLDPTIFSHFPFSSADSTNVARNIGIDSAWKGPYSPQSRHTRALILMERIESHASARRWNHATWPRNLELFG